MNTEKSPNHHHKRTELDESTSLRDVKAPNVFERAKEEIEALFQTIHHKKDSQAHEKRDRLKEAEFKPEHSNSPSAPKDGKAPNFIKRAKGEFEEFIHRSSPHHHHHHQKETHGTSNEIDENTPASEVKAPNVFERAKEEIEAIVQSIHPKKEAKDSPKSSPHHHRHHHKESHGRSNDFDENTPITDIKAPNVFERAKEEIEAIVQSIHPKKESPKSSPHHHHRHHKESHGRSIDFDENTPVTDIKAPNVFERAKEEIEALVQTIHPKKE